MAENKRESKSNLHIGHRARLKKQAALGGIDNWPEHQVLEYLLFFGVPQKDTNELAHKLIEKFGSIVEVFKASADALKTVNGLGDNAASLITLIPRLFRYMENMKINTREASFKDAAQIAEYMIPKFYNVTNELLYVLTLDNKQKLISADIVLDGVVNRVTVDYRRIVDTVVLNNASSIILCHNHPSGFATPSHDDIVATRKVVEFLEQMNVTVVDHVIIADKEYCSMVEMDYLGKKE